MRASCAQLPFSWLAWCLYAPRNRAMAALTSLGMAMGGLQRPSGSDEIQLLPPHRAPLAALLNRVAGGFKRAMAELLLESLNRALPAAQPCGGSGSGGQKDGASNCEVFLAQYPEEKLEKAKHELNKDKRVRELSLMELSELSLRPFHTRPYWRYD